MLSAQVLAWRGSACAFVGGFVGYSRPIGGSFQDLWNVPRPNIVAEESRIAIPEGAQVALREENTPESLIRPENHGNLSTGRTNMLSASLFRYGGRGGSTRGRYASR